MCILPVRELFTIWRSREQLTWKINSAEDQGEPSGSPNWCQCDQYTIPLLTHTSGRFVNPRLLSSISSLSDSKSGIKLSYYSASYNFTLPLCRFTSTDVEQLCSQVITDCDYTTMPTADVPLSALPPPSSASQTSSSAAPPPPCNTDSPSWALTQHNWVDANVDSNIYAWWHGTSDTVPAGVPPRPDTKNDPANSAFGLAQQLVSKAAGIQTFQCQIGADLNCISPQSNFCQYRRSRTSKMAIAY